MPTPKLKKYVYAIIERPLVYLSDYDGIVWAYDLTFTNVNIYSNPYFAFEGIKSDFVKDTDYRLIRFELDPFVNINSITEIASYEDGNLKFKNLITPPKVNSELELDEIYILEYTFASPHVSYNIENRHTTFIEMFSSFENAINMLMNSINKNKNIKYKKYKNKSGAYYYIFRAIKNPENNTYDYTDEYLRVVSPKTGEEFDKHGNPVILFENCIDGVNLKKQISKYKKNNQTKFTYLIDEYTFVN